MKQKISKRTQNIIIAILLITINLVAFNLFLRFDFTKTKQYSVSDSTVKILKNIEDNVNIKVFFTKDLPANLVGLYQYTEDILKEYEAYSKGKVNIKFLDPNTDEKIAEEAKNLGIQELQLNDIKKDEFAIKKGYLGIQISYKEKQEVIPVVQDISNLEYDITSIILRLTREESKTVGFISDYGVESDYSIIKEKLSENYETSDISLKEVENIKNTDTLIFPSPKEELQEEDIKKLDNYLENGGNLAVLVNNYDIGEGLEPVENTHGINKFLEKYNIEIDKNLILDKSNMKIPFGGGFLSYYLPYPFWIEAKETGFQTNNPIFENLNSLLFPWSSSVKILEENDDTKSFIKTTSHAWEQKEEFNLDPNSIEEGEDLKRYNLAVFSSMQNEINIENETETETEVENTEIIKSNLVVFGSSRVITDSIMQTNSENMVFFENLIDYLTEGEALISIRTKNIASYPIKELDNKEKNIIKFVNIVIPTLLISSFGIYLSFRKKKIAKEYKNQLK
ncbi:GldG family protein [Patescibacteria group bacterium]|nr:GldG family protein [Patescibacteria group bacterium]